MQTSGLWSRLRSVFGPGGRDEAPLADAVEPGYSKEALRALIERKRQNDYVRRRELDMLRRLRRREPRRPDDEPDFGRPSYFESSMDTSTNSLEDRSETIRKINEIEAQMSRQWQPERGDLLVHPYASPAPPAGKDTAPAQSTASVPPSAPAAAPHAAAPDERLADPDLEDAAIRFANGDAQGAERTLRAALDTPASSGTARPQTEIWLRALLDLHRATGRQQPFEETAREYIQRGFNAPPAWFSLPALVGPHRGVRLPDPEEPLAPADWISPVWLDTEALAVLQAVAQSADDASRVLDWQALERIAPEAVRPLADLFAVWCKAPMSLVFRGASRLQHALQVLTPSARPDTDPLCWTLRMDALRLMGLQEGFELVALDYCVTYDVSPPLWQPAEARCELQDVSAREAEAEDIRARWDEAPGPGGGGGDQTIASAELYGEITGNAGEVLEKLTRGMGESSRMIVSCPTLIRVDFPAAGALLGWAAEQQAAGRQMQFREVHRLVAAFFNVLGISEHASVVVRRD